MRVRLSALLLAALAGTTFVVLNVPAAHASLYLAQDDAEDEGNISDEDSSEQGESGDTEGEGQSDPAAETGADEGETAEGEATQEEGPPWTYQMARIGIVLMLLVGGLIGFMYYRMIVQRQKEGL